MAESSAMLAAPRTPIADGMRPTDAFAHRPAQKDDRSRRRRGRLLGRSSEAASTRTASIVPRGGVDANRFDFTPGTGNGKRKSGISS